MDLRLNQREQELLASHRMDWEQPFRAFEVANSFRKFVFDIHFRRGFVWGLDINDEERRFADHATEIFRLGPIQRIAFRHKCQHADLARCPGLLRVKELGFDRAGFETEELVELFCLKNLVNVNRLELIADDDNGHLEPAGIELLSRTTNLPALRHLDLSYNWRGWMYDRIDWLTILAKGKLIAQLESLRARGTDVSDSGTEALARCKKLRALKHLDLAANQIGDRGLRALAASKNLPQLVVLDLRRNSYDTDDGLEVAGATPETRASLESRFGKGVLLDGDLDE